MALEKENKNYYYNLGRTVAVVEIMNGLQTTFSNKVFENAREALPYQLREALKKLTHNLLRELVEPADVVLNYGELPLKVMTSVDPMGLYWIGYYHEKAFLADTYKGVYGKVETTIEKHSPVRIDVSQCADNIINELRR
jgi:hypothetical protein